MSKKTSKKKRPKNMSKGENFIHLKFEHSEAINSKRELLTSEIELLNIIKSFERFMALRALELKLKAKFFRESKKLETELKKLEKSMPDVEIPRALKSNAPKKISETRRTEISEPALKTTRNDTLESQLAEIQRKLRELSG